MKKLTRDELLGHVMDVIAKTLSMDEDDRRSLVVDVDVLDLVNQYPGGHMDPAAMRINAIVTALEERFDEYQLQIEGFPERVNDTTIGGLTELVSEELDEVGAIETDA